MDTVSSILAIFLVIFLVCIWSYTLLSRRFWRTFAHGEYERGLKEGIELGRKETATEADEPKRLVKVTVPTFGKPELKVYHAPDFVIPLQCTDCKRNLQEGDDYYEIPVMNAEPGSVTAVHLGCERKNVYGKSTAHD